MTDKKNHNTNIELITKFLSKETSSDENKQLLAWRNSSAQNEKEYKAIEKLWKISELNHGELKIDIDAEWRIQQKYLSPRRKILSLKPIISIAATIVLLITLSILGHNYTQSTTVKTNSKNNSTTTLPDGSIINLNAASQLKYTKQFGKKNRNVKFKGEGFFNVNANKKLPFRILTEGIVIEVVGTQFNVNAYENLAKVKVSVIEGKVWIYAKNNAADTTIISAGETGFFERKVQNTSKIPELDLNDLAWKTKTFDFNDATLFEVTTVLASSYHTQFELNPKVKECKITVDFNQQDLNSILEVLKSTLNLQMKMKGENIYITGKGCISN